MERVSVAEGSGRQMLLHQDPTRSCNTTHFQRVTELTSGVRSAHGLYTGLLTSVFDFAFTDQIMVPSMSSIGSTCIHAVL